MLSRKVSVLVPVYNGEPFLAECLDSILAQNFADMEILIADDASSDGSIELIRRYAVRDPRIRWWKNESNMGLVANFNCCLRAAKGQYIKYLLQDDSLLSPSSIRRMVEALDADPAVSLVGSASHITDEQSRILEYRQNFGMSTITLDGHEVIRRFSERPSNLIGEPSIVMFRRSHATRGYDERYHQLLDLDFWFHLLEKGRFTYLAEPLCAFRQHAKQQTQVNRRSGAGISDGLLLTQALLERSSLGMRTRRQLLFNQIRLLRKLQKHLHAETARLTAETMRTLGWHWYALLWCKRRILQPCRQFQRWMNRRRLPPGATLSCPAP